MGGRLPLRGFELFRGDPLYKLWQEEDRTEWLSWMGGESLSDDAPIEALVPEGQSLAIGRLQTAEFIRRAKVRIVEALDESGIWHGGALGRCLEWDQPFYIIKALAGFCTRCDVLSYADPRINAEQKLLTYPRGSRWLQLDLLSPPDWMPSDYGLIACFFVMEHVPDPYKAIQSIARMLDKGGFLLLGAPFMDGVHGCPDDFFRYTPEGLRRVAESVGLDVLETYSPGSAPVAAGELIGMKSSYWPAASYLTESDTHPTNVFLLARKPWRRRVRRGAYSATGQNTSGMHVA